MEGREGEEGTGKDGCIFYFEPLKEMKRFKIRHLS